MSLTRQEIAALVPHQGEMCLLDEVEQHDEATIVCRTTTHLAASNPLRLDGRLPALAGIEYAAQALAVHCALVDGGAPAPRRRGLLAGVRQVTLGVERLDDVAGPLIVRAERLIADPPRLLYRFSIEDGMRELVSGRVAIVLSDSHER